MLKELVIAMASILLFLFVLTISYYSYKIYYKLTTGWCRSYVNLIGKTVIVTGANTGIGYYAALNFAMRGAKVILACRNRDKAIEARDKIINATNNPNVFFVELNLASFQSVRKFAEYINKTEDKLDILVNNAGIGGMMPEKTVDGLELTMQTNYFSHYLLTLLLLDLLKKPTSSRIVNVSSIGASLGRINLDKITEAKGSPSRIYANSKLCQILFTKELAKRLQGTGVTVYSVHPGCVKTDIFRSVPWPRSMIWKFFVDWFFKTSEEGAQTTLHTALEQHIEHLNGEHFVDCKPVSTYYRARNPELARKLWDLSAQLTEYHLSDE